MSLNLARRIAFSVPAIAGALVVLRIGGWPLAAVLGGLGVLGAREIYDLARRQDVDPLDRTGLLAAGALPLAVFYAKGSEARWAEPVLYGGVLWLLAALAVALWRRGPRRRPLTGVAVTAFGALYASATLAFIIAIRHGANAATQPAAYTWLVVWPLAVTWMCDTCAMAAGTAYGGPKLAPVLSPNKTWAGAVGGTAGGVLAAILMGLLVLPRVGWHFTLWQAALVGLVLSVVGQVGDVAESLFKREAGVKDSSDLIPGHGGALDRLDSLYFVVPVAAALFRAFGVI